MRDVRAWALALAAALLSAAGAAGAATYYVDGARGDDGAAGSKDAPWKTVARGVKPLKAGDTLVIGPGVYREQVDVTAHGTEDARITIRAAEGARPVLSGSDRVADWQPCTQESAGGNADFAHIRTTVIGWKPTEVFEDDKPQQLARTPNEGWWPCEATPTTIKDPAHLTQPAGGAWDGATVFFFRYKGVAQMRQPVKSFDPDTHALTLAAPLSTGDGVIYTPGSDRYILENTVAMIDRPGEWAWKSEGEKKFRLFYWPRAEKLAEAVIEIPRREGIIGLGSAAWCTVEGLELVHALNPGRTADAAIGGDVNKHLEGSGVGIEVRGCSIHHNGRFGWQCRGYTRLKLVGNLVYRNEYGIAVGGCSDVLVEGNEIAEDLVDGLLVTWGAHDVTVRRNYIHHHNLFGHPDNIQLYRDVKNVTFDSNLLLSGGQGVMMEQTDTILFTNNVVAGTAANMIICGHGAADNYTWTRNTFALWASSLFSLTGKNYTMKQNIMVNNGGAIFYGIPAEGTFESDYNLLWRAPGVGQRIGGMKGPDGKNAWFASLEDVRTRSGNEVHSEDKDPQFKNAPLYCTTLDNRRIGDCTRAKLLLSDGANLFQPGDVVEVHFDGVRRKVVAGQAGAITIDPPLETTPDRVMFVVNWKDKTDFTLDFSSPYNNQYGSTINVPAYLKGDFDGDGTRDIPAWR